MAASRRDPFRHPRQQDIRITPRRDTTVHSQARDIPPDRVTLRRDMARSLAQDIRPDRVTPRRDMAHSLARDIRPDRVTTAARAGHSRWPAANRSLTRMSSAGTPSTAAIASRASAPASLLPTQKPSCSADVRGGAGAAVGRDRRDAMTWRLKPMTRIGRLDSLSTPSGSGVSRYSGRRLSRIGSMRKRS